MELYKREIKKKRIEAKVGIAGLPQGQEKSGKTKKMTKDRKK